MGAQVEDGMIGKSIVLDIRHVKWLSWSATWRAADDVGIGEYAEAQIRDHELNKVYAITRKRVINRAHKTLQRRVDSRVERICRQRKYDNEVERVEIILDVTKLRELESA